jgi:hypothetical protein
LLEIERLKEQRKSVETSLLAFQLIMIIIVIGGLLATKLARKASGPDAEVVTAWCAVFFFCVIGLLWLCLKRRFVVLGRKREQIFKLVPFPKPDKPVDGISDEVIDWRARNIEKWSQGRRGCSSFRVKAKGQTRFRRSRH